MISSILESIICTEFENNIKRNQDGWTKKDPSEGFYAMDLRLSLNINYNVGEDGYRNLNLRIYAPMNYVAVLVKEDWTLIHESWSDGDGLLPGKNYLEGNTGWKIAAYHDSCWRTTLADIIRAYEDRLSCITTFRNWYEKKSLSLPEREEINTLVQDYRDLSKHWNSKEICKPLPEIK